MDKYDVIVAGAGVSGLLAALNIARSGARVLILEERERVGWKPCGGLVTLGSLKELGIPPLPEFVIRRVEKGRVYVEGRKFDFSLEPFNLVVLDRTSFDAYLAKRVVAEGGELVLGEKILFVEDGGRCVKTDKRTIETEFFIDARGSRLYTSEKLPAYQLSVTSKDEFYDGISVWIDKERFPKFFGWYIPGPSNEGKLGAAGPKAKESLEKLCKEKNFIPLKVERAALVLGGPKGRFVNGRTLIVGDAAGQTKPTTGGGIYTGGIGGLLAGRWVAEAVKKKDTKLINNYENEWLSRLGRELALQRLIRKAFLMLREPQIKKILEVLKDRPFFEERYFNHQSLAVALILSTPKLISSLAPTLKSLLHKLTS